MDRSELQPMVGRVRLGAPSVALAAALLLAGVLVLAAGAGSTRTPSSVAPSMTASPADASVAAVSLSPRPQSPSASTEIRPAWIDDLAGQLQCDRGRPSSLGTEVPSDAVPMDPAKSPAEAVRIALMSYISLPVKGYAPPEVIGHWARHRYLVGGRLKAVMVSTDRFGAMPEGSGWEVVGVRACDISEFRQTDLAVDGPTIWLGADQTPVISDVAFSHPGPAHCGWEGTIFLYLHREQFFRDPGHVLRQQSAVAFDPTITLPDDAIDTGLHTSRWHLFEIPSGRAVFVRTTFGTVERWPHAKEPIGCA